MTYEPDLEIESRARAFDQQAKELYAAGLLWCAKCESLFGGHQHKPYLTRCPTCGREGTGRVT